MPLDIQSIKNGTPRLPFLWRVVFESCVAIAACVVLGGFAAAMTGLLEWVLT